MNIFLRLIYFISKAYNSAFCLYIKRNLRWQLLLLFSILLPYSASLAATNPITIEVKNVGQDIVFVFHHDNTQILDLKVFGKQVNVSINIPANFELINPNEFKKYAGTIKSIANKQRINFAVNKELKFASIIRGEKLEAIKFAVDKNQAEDLAEIGSAQNDPGAISYLEDNGNHKLFFNTGKDAAVAAFFKGKNLWVVFDQKKFFTFKDQGIFSKFELVPSEKGTVLKMKIEPSFAYAKLERSNFGWVMVFTKAEDKKWYEKDILKPEVVQNDDGFLIKGQFSSVDAITLDHSEIGETLKIIPVSKVGSRVTQAKNTPEYELLKTIQGIAVVFLSDDAKLEVHSDKIKLTTDSNIPDEKTIDANLFPAKIDEYIKLPSILPYLDKNLDIINFNEQKSRLISQAAMSKDEHESYLNNLALARFYFIHGWYQESNEVLKLAKFASEKEFRENLQARFMLAVNHTMMQENLSAKEEYDDLLAYNDIKRVQEIVAWSKYNEFSLGGSPGLINITNLMPKTIALYSDDKYWSLIFGEIEIALLGNDLKLLDKLFKEVKTPKEGNRYSYFLKYYKASYYRKKNQLNLAKQYLRELASQDSDMFTKVRAEFDLIKILSEEGEMKTNEAIKGLERLRYEWRGDQLEYQILLQLASSYRETKDFLNALRTYKYAEDAFNNKISNFYITSEMARIFNDVFLPGGVGEGMDDFSTVALFYEFKALNPIGEQGDDVIISIAKRLVKLDLLENAEDLLRHQITYRLQGSKRVENADNLAIVLMMDKKPSESILVLDETDKDNVSFSEHQYRLRLRARAMVSAEKYAEALAYIKDDITHDAEIIRREALFQAKSWEKYIDQVSSDIESLILKVDNDMAAAQDILRLAISYYMLNVPDKLEAISELVGNRNAVLRDTIDLLVSSSGAVDYRNIDKSLNIDQMKGLLDKYKNQFLSK